MINWRLPLTLLWLLALSVVLTLLGSWLLFFWEIAELNLTASLSLTAQQISSNFNQLMVYLLNPFHHPLQMTDFPVSASGAKHFADVKMLFLLAEGLAILLAPLAWKTLKKMPSLLISRPLLLMAGAPLLIGIFGILIGFDQFFVLFHTVLFPGDSSWLFDPATDPVILILPETYFMHCFILFMAIYELLVLGVWRWKQSA